MTPQLDAARPRGLTRMRMRADLSRRRLAPRAGRTRVNLWLPSTILFALLAPFALALSPLLLLAPTRYRLGPHTVLALGAVLFALHGTRIDVDTPEARVRIHLF